MNNTINIIPDYGILHQQERIRHATEAIENRRKTSAMWRGYVEELKVSNHEISANYNDMAEYEENQIAELEEEIAAAHEIIQKRVGVTP